MRNDENDKTSWAVWTCSRAASRAFEEMIVNDQNRLSDADVRIGTLQDSIETLNSEVKKLSQVLTLLSETSKCQYVSKQRRSDSWQRTLTAMDLRVVRNWPLKNTRTFDQGQGLDLNQECLGLLRIREAKQHSELVNLVWSWFHSLCSDVTTAKVVDWVILEPKKPRYWKGFSRGLKETRKTVAESEEGLPSVQLGPKYKTWPDIVSDQHDRLWHPWSMNHRDI